MKLIKSKTQPQLTHSNLKNTLLQPVKKINSKKQVKSKQAHSLNKK